MAQVGMGAVGGCVAFRNKCTHQCLEAEFASQAPDSPEFMCEGQQRATGVAHTRACTATRDETRNRGTQT